MARFSTLRAFGNAYCALYGDLFEHAADDVPIVCGVCTLLKCHLSHAANSREWGTELM